MIDHVGIMGAPRGAVKVSSDVTGITEGNQVRMGTIRFVVVNMMNDEIASIATFCAFVAVALANLCSKLISPFKRIWLAGYSAAPVGMISSTLLSALSFPPAFHTTETEAAEMTGHNPRLFAANLAGDKLPPLVKLSAALAAASAHCVACLFDAERLAANLANAIAGVFLFGQATRPTAQTAPVLKLCGRHNKRLVAPSAQDLQSRTAALAGTIMRAIDVFAHFLAWVVRDWLPASSARRCSPRGAVRLFTTGVITSTVTKLPVRIALPCGCFPAIAAGNGSGFLPHALTPLSTWCKYTALAQGRQIYVC